MDVLVKISSNYSIDFTVEQFLRPSFESTSYEVLTWITAVLIIASNVYILKVRKKT